MKSRNIAYIAVFCALAVAIVVLTHYVIPAKTVPLALVAFVGLVAFNKTGWGGGIAFAVVVEILTFFFTGLSVSFFTLSVLFVPYIFMAYAVRKLTYTKIKTAIIRGLIAFAYFALTSFALMSLTVFVTGSQSALFEVQDKIGIWLTAPLFAVFCIPADFFISSVAIIITDRLNKIKK